MALEVLTCKKKTLPYIFWEALHIKGVRGALRFASPYTLGRSAVIQEWSHRHCNNK
jgi:hypothetical protein